MSLGEILVKLLAIGNLLSRSVNGKYTSVDYWSRLGSARGHLTKFPFKPHLKPSGLLLAS